jgi:hypothetical protein
MIEFRNFAALPDCGVVIASYERCRAKFSTKVGNPFFDYRVLWISSFPEDENPTRRILQTWRHRASDLASCHAGKRLYSDTIQVVRWDGQEMPPHQDDRHPDGGQHNTPWREWAGVIYLNDDFDGGDIYFPEEGELYKPLAGSFILFEGSRSHGVKAVTRGIRYTSPGWFTSDPTHEDRYARLDY